MTDPHLRRSIELAAEAGRAGDRPFGAVLVSATGAVLAEGRNSVATGGDPTAHAELAALRAAPADVTGATMYASGEPCPMCAAACVWAGIARIVYAASAPAFAPVLPPGPAFTLRCADVVAASNVPVEVSGPVAEPGTLAVMRASFRP